MAAARSIRSTAVLNHRTAACAVPSGAREEPREVGGRLAKKSPLPSGRGADRRVADRWRGIAIGHKARLRGTWRGAARVLLLVLLFTPLSGCVTTRPGALRVWVVDGQQEIGRQAAADLENEVFSAAGGFVRLVTAINDVQSIQIALRAEQAPAGAVQLRLSDLRGTDGALLAGEVYRPFRVVDTRVEDFPAWYPTHTGNWLEPRAVPDVLVPWESARGGPVTPRGSSAEIIWLYISVPPTAAPGEYRGTLELVAGPYAGGDQAAPLFRCELRLTVLPVAIPGEPGLTAIARVDPRELLRAHFNWPIESAAETRILPGEASHQGAVRLIRNTFGLLHEHRLTPVLWGSFPKYHVSGGRDLRIEWEPYDQLVEGWISGDNYADRVGAPVWPLPVSDEYPSAAREGGFASESYARLLADYLRACGEHFAERGWSQQALLRAELPTRLTATAVDRVRKTAAAMKMADLDCPLMAHLPARSLRGFGWADAPSVELSEVSIMCPPAGWLEPAAIRSMQATQRRIWFVPDAPPYSGTLSLAGGATDARVLGWQAARYGLDGIWLETVAPPTGDSPDRARFGDPLIRAGREHGLTDAPVPTVRLKRLRRGLLDAELVALLRRSGQPLLADRSCAALTPRAFLDACAGDLLTCQDSGWSRDPGMFALGRRLVLQELANHAAPTSIGGAAQIENLASWARLLADRKPYLEVVGARLAESPSGLRAEIEVALSNSTDSGISGSLTLADPPIGWSRPEPIPLSAAAGGLGSARMEIELASLSYDADGAAMFAVEWRPAGGDALRAAGRLAVTAVQRLAGEIRADGKLDDWPTGPGSSAGGFVLVNQGCGFDAARPARIAAPPTRVTFARDEGTLYIAVRAELAPGSKPHCEATNSVRIQGAQPWGEDVIELLCAKPGVLRGSGEDLFVLRIKPNGVTVGRRGCLVDPPIYRSTAWSPGADVAARVEADAWVVEAAIPLAALAVEGQTRVLGLNVLRLEARSGQYSSWSGVRGSHGYRPELLGNLLLSP